ncbi:MAG: PEP-CTERM sorting domain-containing protein [Candidatus Auribacterota bacterium]
MKKVITSSLVTLFVLVISCSIGMAQSINIKWTNASPVLDFEGNQLAMGASIMVMMTDATKAILDPVESVPYFASGSNDIAELGGFFAGYNPLPYNPQLGGSGGFVGVSLDTPSYDATPGAANKVYVFLRVFDNIAYNAFSGGNWNGTEMSNGRYGNDIDSYYFDTGVYIVSIPEIPGTDAPITIDISGMQTLAVFPVPEPSVMLLAGFGAVFFAIKKRIKK